MIRMFLCVGMFAFGYYIGRRAGQQELAEEWIDPDPLEEES